MAIGSLEKWKDFDRIGTSLADVTGSPGLPEAAALADQISHAFGAAYEQLPVASADAAAAATPFVVGNGDQRLSGSPQAQLSGFFRAAGAASGSASTWAGFAADTMKVLIANESPTGTHIVAQQTIQGKEIVGARCRLHLDGGRAYALTGRPIGDVESRDPGERPNVSEATVIKEIRKLYRLPRDHPVNVELVVFPIDGRGVWAYQGRFVLYNPIADVRAFVRADNPSEVLYSFNAAVSALRGEADVYRVNPRRTPDLERVRLDRMGPVPSDQLTGGMVTVKRHSGVFTNPTRDCRLKPTDPGFDEAHAFYHLSNAVRYFQLILDGTLFDAAPFAPISALVRDPMSPRNAFYMPTTGELRFGDFADRPSARSAEIIYHEFAHAVTDAICRLGRTHTHTESRGLSEGYSDYFAASALNDPRIGDYVLDKPNGARNCAGAHLRFPAGFVGQEHATGEVWAGVLWAVRTQCGVGVTDMLALESLQFLAPFSRFEEGLAALITADRRLFPTAASTGRHEDVLRAEFDARRPA